MAGFLIRQEMIKKHINHLVVYTTSAFVASLLAGMAYVYPFCFGCGCFVTLVDVSKIFFLSHT